MIDSLLLFMAIARPPLSSRSPDAWPRTVLLRILAEKKATAEAAA